MFAERVKDEQMSIARIQFLHKTDIGWHIRFTGILDGGFQTTLERFKEEQRKSAKINCHWNPALFNGKGGWFVTESILLKYQDYFENYTAMRRGAEVAYDLEHQEDLWGETKSERKQDEEEVRFKAEEAKQQREWEEAQRQYKQARERTRQWKQWEREQQEEQQSRPPARPTSTGLTLSEALIELGFSALDKPTEIEVKKAFRQLAMVKHPDHGGDHLAFIKLNKTYQLVLWHVAGVRI